ncbi:MAG TPA: CpaD family pilus assembly protein [Xanthobacteraceae bacterium]|nr:CpaD family pilus assembly protein [Xanthobacteraceae bacterium]
MTRPQENKRRKLSAVARGLFAAASALALSGCFTAKDTTGAIPADYRQRHPITLKEKDHTVAILVGTSRGGLNAEQRADALAFAQRWKREATGGIIIDQPVGTPNAASAAAAAHETLSIFAAAGIPASAIAIRPYQPKNRVAVAALKLNYPVMAAEAGPCGLWPADLGPTDDINHNENAPYWNLGCASQRNLAAMVANPADLVQPRGETPPSAQRRSVMIEKYRKGENPSGTYPTAAQAKISDVGK